MEQNTVVVTGASGRVGVKIVQALLAAGYHVHIVVRSQLPAHHPLARENVAVTMMDLASLPEERILHWLNALQPTALIHSAALADVSDCERQPSLAYLMNVQVTGMLARACACSHIHFIMLSTEHVFGGTPRPDLLYSEDDPVHPLNTYGKSKVQGEFATQAECAGKTLWTICRLSSVYGLAADPTLWPRPEFTQWVRATLSQQKTLRVAVDQVNAPIHVVDLTEILAAVVRQKLHGIYHVAGSTPISRYDFARQIARVSGLNETLIHPVLTSELASSIPRPLNVGLCIDKISHDTGIHPLSLEKRLASHQVSPH